MFGGLRRGRSGAGKGSDFDEVGTGLRPAPDGGAGCRRQEAPHPMGPRAVGGKRPRGSYFYRERVVLWRGDFGIIPADET